MAEERDREPFEQLYRSHRGAVYRFLRRDLGRLEAEDITQTAFAQAYSAYLRGTRPERPRAWLLTIAENLRRRGFRGRRIRGEELALDEELTPARDTDERVADLRDALETLPLNQRAALLLREVAGLSYDEIARSLRLSVGSVQMLLFRARRSMREELAVTSRRGLAVVPTWLTNLVPSLERVATPLRAAGAATALATAAIVVSGAEPATAPMPASPPSLPRTVGPQSLSNPASATTDDVAQPRPRRRAAVETTPGRPVPAAPVETAPGRPVPAAPVETAPGRPVPAAPVEIVAQADPESSTTASPPVEPLESIVRVVPALAPLPEPAVEPPVLPPLPTLPPVEPPALPIPAPDVIEGALDP
jgi:RNA polymerase sigma-70 factor (ECF subfamily)